MNNYELNELTGKLETIARVIREGAQAIEALRGENEKLALHIKHIGNDALRTENAELRAQLEALQTPEELPPFPMHPEPHTYCWTSAEESVICAYARQAQALVKAKMEVDIVAAYEAGIARERSRCLQICQRNDHEGYAMHLIESGQL